MRLIGYVRVSTSEQAKEGHSLAAQEEKIRQYCALYDHHVVWVYYGEGESAKTLDRPALQDALRSLACGDADGLIVTKLDRLTRSVGDFADLIEGPFKTKTLVSVTDSIDTSSAAGRLVLNVLMSVAQWEREAISERTRETMAHMKREGKRVGGVPYGWRDVDGRLVEDEEEQEVVQYVQNLRDAGYRWSCIVDVVNECGYRSRSGAPFLVTQIKRMVK